MQATVTAINKAEWAWVGLALALLAAVAVQPSIRGNDGVGHYAYLSALLRDGSLDLTDTYARFDALKQYSYKFSGLPRSPVTGRPSNRYGIGAACLWAPFVLAAHGALKLAGSPQATALTRPYEWAVGLGTAFWASVGLALIYGRLRRRLAPLACAAVAAGLVLATPLGFYMYAHGSMSHGVSFFAAAALLLGFERAWERPAPARLAWCGFWAAWLVMCRFQDATWVIVAGAALAGRVVWLKRSGWVGILSFSGGFFAVFWVQMAVWNDLYGSWISGPMPYLDETAGTFSRWPMHALEALFSGRHGLLAWHPLIALGLAGLVWKRGMRNAECGINFVGLAGFAAQLWIVGCWSMWWAGASFGNRFFISSLPWVGLGLGRLAEGLDTRRKKAVALGVLAVLVAWNMGLLVQYATEMIPREEWVSWGRIARQNVVDVPGWVWGQITGK